MPRAFDKSIIVQGAAARTRSLWSHVASAKRHRASDCVIAGASASNLPVFRSFSATWRVAAIAISDTALAVLARATPSVSILVTLGRPARTMMAHATRSSSRSR
jgi:hypothetical protein